MGRDSFQLPIGLSEDILPESTTAPEKLDEQANVHPLETPKMSRKKTRGQAKKPNRKNTMRDDREKDEIAVQRIYMPKPDPNNKYLSEWDRFKRSQIRHGVPKELFPEYPLEGWEPGKAWRG